MTDTLTFPPLLWGEPVATDAFEHAAMRAAMGCDAGLVVYALAGHVVQAALVFAPEVPLRDAMAMLPLCGIGFQNALGALAPPEIAVHLDWDGGIRINNAACGRFRCIASTTDPDTVPDQTALYAEGCSEVSPPALVEAWARHSLHWINRWDGEGVAPLHSEWRGLAYGIGEETTQGGKTGTYLGVDERFGLLLRDADTTHLIPLTAILEPSP